MEVAGVRDLIHSGLNSTIENKCITTSGFSTLTNDNKHLLGSLVVQRVPYFANSFFLNFLCFLLPEVRQTLRLSNYYYICFSAELNLLLHGAQQHVPLLSKRSKLDSGFVFWEYPVRNSAETWSTLTEVFRSFSQFLHTNAGIIT